MMEEQLNLFDQDPEVAEFEAYDAAHPQIWRAFEALTLQAINRGFKHYGSQGIIEIIRWKTGINAEFPDGFKINNNFGAHYSRKFMRVHPQHDGFFRIRTLRKIKNQ